MRGVRKDFLFVVVPKLLNGFATFLVAIYTVRFLDPAGYGVLSFGLNCLVLFDALVGSALDLATVGSLGLNRFGEGPRISAIEKATVWLKFATGAALLCLFALSGESLGYRFFHQPGGRGLFLVLTVAGTGLLLLRSVQVYFQARLRFSLYGAADLLHTALRVLFIGAVLFAGTASAFSVIACLAVAPVIVVTAFSLYGRTSAGWHLVRSGWFDCRALLLASAPVLASFGVSSLVSRLDIFLVALRGTPAQLGHFGAALTIATIPEIIGAYLAPVFLPRILPACQDGSFYELFRRFQRLVYLVCGVLLAAGLLLSRPLLPLLLPHKYSESIDLVMILIPGTLAVASIFPLTLNFVMLHRPRIFLIVDILAAPVLVIAYYFLIPRHGVVAAAWITCIYRLSKGVVIQTIAFRLARQRSVSA